MHLAVRPATIEDGTTLVRVLDAAYAGGYSATFDRDGPLQPNDLWWARSEKDISVIEVNRDPSGMLVVGRSAGQWLVEEILLDGFSRYPARTQEALLGRISAHLTALFQRAGQDAMLLRVADTNPFGLLLVRSLHAAFTNALLVHRYRGPKRPGAGSPTGYEVRRWMPADAREVGRLVREVTADRGRIDEVERAVRAKDAKGYVACRDGLAVGVATVELRPGRPDWFVGVRETHRRRGLGRALAHAAIGAMAARGTPPYATVWALDPIAGPFLRALGFVVERTYLYVEKPL
ncbi:MAG: GNAT family N-acetyltransferase [Armatimonadetes bacterium]|nr:GNAT family N-acetyltransferase [Armatimonadota bacterium]